MKKKRSIAHIALGWSCLLFSSYVLYESIAALSQMCYYYPSPLPVKIQEIFRNITSLPALAFISVTLTLLFSILMLSASLAILNQKRWGIRLFLLIIAADIIKRVMFGVISLIYALPIPFPFRILTETALLIAFIIYLTGSKVKEQFN